MYSLLKSRPRHACRRPFSRCPRMEVLEPRLVLSAPSVTDVNVSSTAWTTEFIDYLETEGLGTDGFSIPVGSSDQLKTLPWVNLDQIQITFSEDVDVQMGDLSLSGVNTTAYAFSDFSYDSNTYTATWTLTEAIQKDKLLIDLDGDGLDPVTDTSENVLDGEWTTATSTYNSGNGTAGGDFEFRFNVLPGDVSRDGYVNTLDSMYAMANRFKEAGDPGYSAFRDVDGDAEGTTGDWYMVFQRIGSTLPTGDPVGMTDDAPTTAGFADVNVDEDAADVVLSLFNAFDDAEDDDDDLTYQIIDNTNPDLFDSVDIDDINGELTLDFAFDEFGEALLTVRAIDSNGLFIDTTIAVNAASTNQAPVITNFVVLNEGFDIWTIEGHVTDVDDNVEGMIITIGGILAEYNLTATVAANGSFSITQELVGVTTGTASAQTEDDEGAKSDIRETLIVIS